ELPDGRRWRDADIDLAYCRATFGACESSNHGPWLDITAPGGRYITTLAAGPADYYSVPANCEPGRLGVTPTGFRGTTAAAPMVAGVASLLRSIVPTLTGEDLALVMDSTALNESPATWTDLLGWGALRADRAFAYITPPKRVTHGFISCGPELHNGIATVVD